jgi:hypothetical protein
MRKNISMTIALLCMVVQTAWAQFSGGSGYNKVTVLTL